MPSWSSLPMELRLMIFNILEADGPGHLSSCAVVCKDWHGIVEPRIFRRLKLQRECIYDFEDLVTHRTQHLVETIWLHVQLPPYTCRICRQQESDTAYMCNNNRIKMALVNLFNVLETWSPTARLTLELSACSPSDLDHWFKNYCFGHKDQGVKKWHDPQHGWYDGRQDETPVHGAIKRLFGPINLIMWNKLSEVPAITRLVIRRQLRRRLTGRSLRLLMDRLPRLESLAFEPWREWDPTIQVIADAEYQVMFNTGLPKTLKRLSIFEDFNESHMEPIRKNTTPLAPLSLRRIGDAMLGKTIANQSRQLTHLSVSYMIEAVHFLFFIQRNWVWQHLEFLSLTSLVLVPSAPNTMTWGLLRVAACVATKMPKLQKLVLWNGRNGCACAFIYSRKDRLITWRSTWDLEIPNHIEDDWRRLLPEFKRCFFRLEIESLNADTIHNHGDAIRELKLPSGIIDPRSLNQIHQEAMRL